MSFNLQVEINTDSNKVFEAITNHVQDWWGNTDKAFSAIGDEFTTSFDKTYWKFKIAELDPNSKIVWECIEANHVHDGYEKIQTEWEGTSVEWLIEQESPNKTILTFAHNGLEPNLNCYEVCTPAWEMFVTKSLKKFVETGRGTPALM